MPFVFHVCLAALIGSRSCIHGSRGRYIPDTDAAVDPARPLVVNLLLIKAESYVTRTRRKTGVWRVIPTDGNSLVDRYWDLYLAIRSRMTPKAIKVGLVGSQALFREALCALIRADEGFEITFSLGTVSNVRPSIEEASADVMVFHLCPGTQTSDTLLQELARVTPHTRAIVLACLTDVADYSEAVELGAMGIVSCEEPGAVLLKAIRKVHAGELWLDRARTAGVVTRLTRGLSYKDPDTVKIASLTPRQREIVVLVAEGLTNKQLAERLFITEATARNHMTAILDKLELSDKFQLAVYAFRHGLAHQQVHLARISSAR